MEEFKEGDLISFKFYSPDYIGKKIEWVAKTTKVVRVIISPNPNHIPHKLVVKLADGDYGIRLDELLKHEPVLVGQQELF